MKVEDKLLRMFHVVNPDFKDSRSFAVDVIHFDDWEEEDSGYHIRVIKGGQFCWGYTQAELLFEYLTLDWVDN